MNVVGIRLALGESLVAPRSHCRECSVTLGPAELVPVISYLWSRGRCRHCGTKISPVYPLGEAAAVAIGLLLAAVYGLSVEYVILSLLFLVGIAVSVSDVFFMKIPNIITLPMIAVFLAIRVIYHPEGLFFYLGGGILGGGILFLLACIYPKGMGGGDIKLFFLMGLGLGWPNTLVALFLASLLGSVWGIALLVLRIKQKGEPVPFGPFIVLASLTAAIWGNSISLYYWHLQY